ncbi:MAG: branched-chain amino acid ABC transporter permease [Bradyrhizobium sp.]|uniref:branched-chain amino acid ABC transporter permease n=1 Tax=Bradyrhizobium sp. TaxID=376 RepID=UPI003BB01D74
MTQAGSQPLKIAGITGRALVVVLIVLAIAAALPLVLSTYQIGLATEMLIFGMLAMSIDILAGFAGRTSLGHGAIFGVSGYVVVYASSQAGLPWAAAFVLGMIAATAVAAIFALLAVRTSGVYFLLLTLALGMIVWGICLRWTQVTGGENGIRGDVRPAFLVAHRSFYWAVLVATAIVSYAMWRFVRSPFGLTLLGIRDSESRMKSLGYNVPLHLFVGFAVSGFFAGVAGALYAMFNDFVSPSTVALEQSVEGVLMMIAGGVGTLFGGFVGAAAILTLENVVSSYTERWQTVLGLTFIVIMICAPDGIIGTLRAILVYRFRSSSHISEPRFELRNRDTS